MTPPPCPFFTPQLKAYLNGTVTTLSAPLREALQSKFPTFSLNLTKPDVPTLSLNIPRPDLNLAELLPSVGCCGFSRFRNE